MQLADEEGQKTGRWRLSAFGLAVESEFALPGGHDDDGRSLPREQLVLRLVSREELEPLAREARVLSWLYVFDDCPYAMLEGADGDVLLHYGHRALFHLSADRQVLRCAPTDIDEPTWQRVLLDTVLWTASLLRGYELLHASAVQTESGVVAFLAGSGGGKTTLAAEHLRRGSVLFCDDILALDDSGPHVVGAPGPPVMNLPRHLVHDLVGESNVIADFGEEQWVVVDRPPLAAQRLAALVVVDRAAGRQSACSELEATSLTLLPHAIRYPDLPVRERRRFEICGRVATTTAVLHLTAEPSVPTGVLADLVEERIASL